MENIKRVGGDVAQTGYMKLMPAHGVDLRVVTYEAPQGVSGLIFRVKCFDLFIIKVLLTYFFFFFF